jgi:hypothetical protein
MVGHQDVCVNVARMPPRQFMKQSQVQLEVVGIGEAGLPIVSTVHDVQGKAGDSKAGLAGHGGG